MSANAHRYSCDQLGACQARPTPCAGCSRPTQPPFAPGVIERHTAQRGNPQRRIGLNTAARCALIVIVLGLVLAHLSGAFQP